MTSQLKTSLRNASQAEILRSHQRDSDFVSQISETISDLLHRYDLFKHFSRFAKSDVLANLVYFAATSGLGNQTLGEEYTGIVQANLRTQRVPSVLTRVFTVLLECFGEQILLRLLDRLQIHVNRSDNELTPQARSFLNVFLSKSRRMIPIIILVHRGLFYIFGRYYSLGRRLTGLDYVKVYGPRPHSSVSWGLRILGFATILQCFFRLWQTQLSREENSLPDKDFDGTSNIRCQLCLEKVSDTTTPCGHLFCWTCLAEWLQARSRCPLCRECVISSRMVPLMNL
ncbi:hypothetical protein QAD02_006865 [Eretmocerus hayati]|uniref:Uncharacterized protein n=1 Tax=Eretmocerus hayati TaxID=131215 RepID=A0ACC2N2I4_9HYME|nr:hypothetical protein QAD02_006865 [Eretmocerus hayati]